MGIINRIIRKPRNNKGVTIVELLVALAIIASLTTVITSGAIRAQKEKKAQSIAIDKGTIATQSQRYYLDNNIYPATTPIHSDIVSAENEYEEQQVDLYLKLTQGEAYINDDPSTWNGFSVDRVKNDFKLVDIALLVRNDYIKGLSNPDEEFILDTKTGNVYHHEDSIETIMGTMTDNEDLDNVEFDNDNYVIEIKIETGETMEQILYMLDLGTGMLVGGEGQIVLAYVSKDTHKVIDYTPRLRDKLETNVKSVYFIAKSGSAYKVVGTDEHGNEFIEALSL